MAPSRVFAAFVAAAVAPQAAQALEGHRHQQGTIEAVEMHMYTSECGKLSTRQSKAKAAMFPGAGTDPSKIQPFEKVLKDGFYQVDCVKDMMFHHGDKFHDNKFDYDAGKVADVSIVHYDTYVAKEDQEPMTVEVCWNFCKNVSGAQFFGLRRGAECYCTPAFDSFSGGNDDATACDQPCDGNPSQMCGGDRHEDMYEMHDCNNLPAVSCKTPPMTPMNAKVFYSKYYRTETPCKNAMAKPLDTKGNHKCEVECEEGYHVATNQIECKELGNRLVYSWAQLVGQAACVAVSCGVPPTIDHATSPLSEVKFPDSATYQCDIGFSLNGTAQGKKQQQVQCLSSGAFSEVKPCLPTKCGTCPSGEKLRNAAVREIPGRVYREICTYDCNRGFSVDARPDGRKTFDINCQFTGEFEEPESCRPIMCGQAPGVANAALRATWAPGRSAAFQDAVPYECAKGFTLNGYADGDIDFTVGCQDDGTFQKLPQCRPVRVGNPPFVNNSVYLDRMYFYGESVTYTCNMGYTLDGTVDGLDQATLFAGADGRWAGETPRCLPVVCGAPPSVEHASINGTAPGTLNFDSAPVQYVCDPGYSTTSEDDIWEPAESAFLVNCLATGQFDAKKCVNIDDCRIRNCGSHGTCEDLPSPGTDPLDNYKCNCDSGFEVTLHPSANKEGMLMKRCTNINDCPVPLEEA
eukprot:CAMPEP_0170323550 /NCGR_PEP_ID=MMETSP0116_2-20130129/62586_1 /TAXON_ID=400756 /ORGANISM="Durinskia baltica, Strain CSIRO CS-38" /LENGTH=688 /DNA_ID=CAMNT_0010576475 /DNA_START=414 /DNA_END=2476 /DNA_ORIENTATION=+